MQSHQSLIDDLNKYTVAIKDRETGETHGTGVIVTNDGLILTCYHIIGNIENEAFYYKDTIDIYFPEANITKPANIEEKYCNARLDVAFLKLNEDGEKEKLPTQITVAPLSESVLYGHKFASIGFRKARQFKKLDASGEIRIETGLQNEEDEESPSIIKLYSGEIEEGMSGAAVLDLEINRVVGIVSLHYPAKDITVDTKLNFAIPVKSIVKVCLTLKEKNPGLKKFNSFVQLIGKSGSFIHDRFEDVYVSPIEYEEMERTLKEHRCIFITGSAEYGKTYTAINLLWEFYKNGYVPKYIEEGSKETNEIITKLVTQDKSLENNVIYIEDPVGKSEYRSNKQFEESIGSIISGLGHLNANLVVTMREEIYQKFNPIGKEDLKKYIKKLNMANHSYDSERRKEVLLRWATAMNCKWFHDENLREAVLKYIENDETKLPTPLNIKDFASETAGNSNILNREKLLQAVDKKSRSTPERFARDIMEMEERGEKYKVLFLCFPFISEWFSIDFVKTKYTGLLDDWNIKDDYAFKRVHAEFQDKIEFSQYIRFSHPSYSEALPYLLLQGEIPTKINDEIFSKFLVKLHNDNFAASDVANTIASNYDRFARNVRDLLFDMANDTILSEAVAEAIQSNFDKLPGDVLYELLMTLTNNDYKFWDTVEAVCNIITSNADNMEKKTGNLLFNLADNSSAALIVSRALTDNFDNLTNNFRNDLLLKLIETNSTDWTNGKNILAAEAVVECLLSNFDKFTENIRNKLFYLTDESVTAKPISKWIKYNFDKLPQDVTIQLLYKLQTDKDTAEYVARTITNNYDKLPDDIRNILFRLADRKDTAEYVARTITNNYDKLPDNVRDLLLTIADKYQKEVAVGIYDNFLMIYANARNKLLVKLTDSKDSARDVARIVFENFDKLPENIQNILFKLADNKETALGVAQSIAYNFDKLPENVRNKLLFKLADNRETAEDVADTITNNFDKLPKDVRNKLLLKLAESEEAAWYVANAVTDNFDRLPENLRNELLLKLADKKEVERNVSYTIAKNFDRLPENVQNLLFKLADNKETAGNVSFAIAWNFDELPENVRNELLLKLADKETAGNVSFAIAWNFYNVPERVQNLLFKLADNKIAARYVANAVTENFDKLPGRVQNLLFKLADNKEAARYVANAVATNFDRLPENVRNELLLRLADNTYAAEYLSAKLVSKSDKLPQDVRNKLFKT